MSPRYTALMASLPPLGGLFEARSPAISRLKLERRLSLLEDDDRHSLDLAISILSQSMRPQDPDGGPSDSRRLVAKTQRPSANTSIAPEVLLLGRLAPFARRRSFPWPRTRSLTTRVVSE